MTRRGFVAAAATTGAGVSLGAYAATRLPSPVPISAAPICRVADLAPTPPVPGAPRALKITWATRGVCNAALPAALEYGLFKKYNLDVELINYGGFTDQLLEAISTGKVDAGVGMSLRWFKALEQGFDVKLTSGIHGGCERVLAPKGSGLTSLADLRGKRIGVGDTGGNAQNFFSIRMAKLGWDPNQDVTWRTYPAALLAAAVAKGEVDALADGDPNAWLIKRQNQFVEIADNQSDEFANRVCCVLGIRGNIVREEPAVATAITRALLEGAEITAKDPRAAAAAYAKYAPNIAVDDLTTMLSSHHNHIHPMGADFRQQIALYAEELKLVHVLRPSTDTQRFASRVFADVLNTQNG